MLTSAEIRRQFIDYFVERCGHTAVPSSPVVPHDDPTLLFTNAGMNQFKDVFLGVGDRPYTRAVDTQKCIRAGGKHNDLDDVGKDTYHHTFFEMLGNWSFGDYFKREAIEWAWGLLTDVWGMDKSRLHVTVFEGNEAQGLDRDDEAAELWKSVTDIDPTHIHLGDMKDNFWEMGETGPCGPCSEIHIDLTPDKSGAALVNGDDPRVIEIWNLVFIQFNRNTDGSLAALPAKHVDTGMGFERVCAVLQGKKSNYETDVFTPIFAAIRDVTGVREYTGVLDDPIDIAYRVIADHIRCLTFAITDGALPSNEGRGYVLRRILRRAVRYGRQTLGVSEPFFHRLVPAVVDQMGEAFPEITRDPQQVTDVLKEEEELFGRTLDRGIALFDEAAQRAESEQGKGKATITGADAFELYATFGFPLDLTQLMAEERGMTVDVEGFNAEYEQHRQISKAGAGGADAMQSLVEIVQRSDLAATKFAGYEHMFVEQAKLVQMFALQDNRYEPVTDLEVGQPAALIVDRTPFYAEAGGQVGDIGRIHSTAGSVFRVDDTQKIGDVWFHLGELESGSVHSSKPAFSEEDELMLEVDAPRRKRIMAHHTVTHVMNHKLRHVLGDHVQQKGSLVDEEKTRFDFAHNQAVKVEQIEQVEQMIGAEVKADLTVNSDIADQEEALQIKSLRAVFGEKYPPKVRVISIGPEVADVLADPDNDQWFERSIEFCGGTHVAKTSEIGSFVITTEEAVAKGIRRLVGIAGEAAEQARANAAALREKLEGLGTAKPETLAETVSEVTDAMAEQVMPLTERTRIREALESLQKQLKAHQKQADKEAAGQVVDVARGIAEAADGELIVTQVEGADGQTLRTAMDVIRKTQPDAAMLLAATSEGKVALLASVPKAMIERGLKAGDWVKVTAQQVGGGGGGRPDMAQAGGKDPSKIDQALETAMSFAKEKLAGA